MAAVRGVPEKSVKNAVLNSFAIWILDSRATDYNNYSLEYFDDYHKIHGIFVQLPNGETVAATHIGEIRLQVDVLFQNVLYIPSFAFNIISASKLAKQSGYEIVMGANSCTIQGHLEMMAGFAKEDNGLYLITHPPVKKRNPPSDSSTNVQCNSLSVETWHNRIGHYRINKIHSLNFSAKIKVARIDNGGEFMMTAFLNENGIVHPRSCVHTPPQNGVAERKHHYILNVARELRFQSGLPMTFWGHCVLHSSFLINILPIAEKIPFEILFGKAVNYDQLKSFGCLCFGATISQGRNKMQSRARKCVFIGFPANVKGYMYDMADKSIFFSPTLPLILISITTDISPTLVSTDECASSRDILCSTGRGNAEADSGNAENSGELEIDINVDLGNDNNEDSGNEIETIDKFISYDNLQPSHKFCTLSISSTHELQSYNEVVKHEEWRKAMQTEIEALVENNTWTLTDLPPGKIPIGGRWVYKIKHKADAKKQATISRSSSEVEYRALASTTCEIQWLLYLLANLKICFDSPIALFCDNKSVVAIGENYVFHERTKHIEIDFHFVRQKVHEGVIKLRVIPSNKQVVDGFTKALSKPLFDSFHTKLSLQDVHAPAYTGLMKEPPSSNQQQLSKKTTV
ncbi:PREDICTED: uncharacterized protein LOC109162901 [Ipomoea nil]|uniref:uncharacterized protein LOC109162901 n=1 Tax=Ipomoea nil TaxID=35883 RepID=UPI0009015648|nr:PREDICTED: uncharacterized protein LOC109162901 [Ipomoea nil]